MVAMLSQIRERFDVWRSMRVAAGAFEPGIVLACLLRLHLHHELRYGVWRHSAVRYAWPFRPTSCSNSPGRDPPGSAFPNLTSPIRALLRMFSSRRISDGTTRISCNAADRLLIEGMGQHSVGGKRASLARTQMSENGKRGEEGPGTGVVVKTKPKRRSLPRTRS